MRERACCSSTRVSSTPARSWCATSTGRSPSGSGSTRRFRAGTESMRGVSIHRPFGARLVAAIDERGPLCVGIDPHPGLLQAWGLPTSVAGLERFALTVVEALAPTVAVLKPQSAFFESYGSAGIAVLERVLADTRQAGACLLYTSD